MSDYQVRPGTRVLVGGRAYSDGETFTAEPGDVQRLLDEGWVSKAVHADEVEDKAVTRKRAPRKQR